MSAELPPTAGERSKLGSVSLGLRFARWLGTEDVSGSFSDNRRESELCNAVFSCNLRDKRRCSTVAGVAAAATSDQISRTHKTQQIQ